MMFLDAPSIACSCMFKVERSRVKYAKNAEIVF